MAYTPAPPIDMSKVNFGQFNPNLQQTAAPTPPPYSGTTAGYQPSSSAPAYNGTTSGYKPPQAPNPVSAPPQTAAPKPQAQGTPTQAQKVPGGWMTADGQFVPVPNAGGTPAPPRPQEPPNYQFQPHTPAPPQMQQPTAAPVYKDPYARTPESIAALAKERVQKILQAGKTSAQGALTGAKNAYDYTNQIEGDTRTLRNAQFKETSNPFSGNTGYQAANMQRNDSIQDTAQNKDYNAQVGLINQKLADLEAAAPGDEQAIIDQLQQIERQTGISVAQLQEQQRQNQFNNNMQTNQFNRGVYESDRGFSYGMGQDAIQNNRADRQLTGQEQNQSFNQGMQNRQFEYGAGQDAIANNRNAANDEAQLTGNYTNPATKAAMDKMSQNSAAWFNASAQERARLSAENQRLGASIGAQQDANGDWTMPQSQRTVAGRAADEQNKIVQQQLTNGQIDQETAQFKLDQLKDPNSPVNRASQIDMELKQLELQYAEPEMKARLEQIRKATAQIGAAPYQSDLDRRLDQVRLDTATEELKQLKEPKAAKGMTAEEYDKNLNPQVDNYGKLTNAQQMEDQILLSGLSDYEQYKLYIKHGIPWTDPIPTK